jgi:hypothetical protein
VSIQEQAWWPKNGLYNTLLSKMCQLRTRKIRGLDALIAAVSPQIIWDHQKTSKCDSIYMPGVPWILVISVVT